jgi:hypothetical protein
LRNAKPARELHCQILAQALQRFPLQRADDAPSVLDRTALMVLFHQAYQPTVRQIILDQIRITSVLVH